MSVLMALGPFRFETSRTAHDSLERATAARWPSQERIGRPPARQFVGPGDDDVTIAGTLYPEVTGGLGQIETMRQAARAGQSMMLVSGRGRVFGRFVITDVETTGSFLGRDGEPRKLEFQLSLSAYGEDGAGTLGRLFG